MVPFFPRPEDGESIYSLISRYHRQAGYGDPRFTLLDLFGSDTASVSVDLPGRLDELARRIDSPAMPVERLIRRHTLFPLYAIAMPAARGRKLMRLMRRPSFAGNLHAWSGLLAGGLESHRRLRACPRCFASDVDQHRTPIWRTIHQLSGMKICPWHGELLLETSLGQVGRARLVVLDRNLMARMSPVTVAWRIDEKDFRLARAALGILVEPSPEALESRGKAYRAALEDRGLLTRGGSIRWKALVPQFDAFWGLQRMNAFRAVAPVGRYSHWLAKVLHGRETFVHPLRHLMLSVFLESTPSDPVSATIAVAKPFGQPPWPCLNPVCSQYRKLVIWKVTVKASTHAGSVSGLFTHRCGYSYRRVGADPGKRQHFKKDQVVRFGEAWERRCRKLALDEHVSWRSAARRLGVDVKTVQARARTPEPPSNQRTGLEELRTQWRKSAALTPTAGITKLRRASPALYARLYRRDREWLLKFRSGPVLRPAQGRRADWASRDRQLSCQVSRVAKVLKRASAKLRRASTTRIITAMGARAMLEQKRHLLPLTSRQLRIHAESAIAFRQRRLWFAYKKAKKQREKITRSALLWRARIRPEFADDVADLMSLILGSVGGEKGQDQGLARR